MKQHNAVRREVLGITLSTEQLSAARERARKCGVEADVKFELRDYRALEGTFDRIVSVGMFEHVGLRYYQTFFKKCHQLLAPDGVMLLHTIGFFDGPWDPNPWINKYIFPGGHLPALSQIVTAIERSGLIVTDVECLRLHYAKTLVEWRRRFMTRRDEVLDLYDERFFKKCHQLLAPDGVMLLHTIGFFDGPWDPNPWINKYIFPGGHLPALSQIVTAIERSGLIVTDVECLRLHYAKTLVEWRRRFMTRRDEVLDLYDEWFFRMWEFYFAGSEASFRYRNLGVFQVQCAHHVDALPMTRDYIAARILDLRNTEVRRGVTESLRGKVREA